MPWAGSFICHSFKRELFEGKHNFLTDTFKLALYTDIANLTPVLEGYESFGEVPPLYGYTTGGQSITLYPPKTIDGVAVMEFGNVTWSSASFTARGALCYNASKNGSSAFVLDFGVNRIANDGNFVVVFPGPDPHAAILRIA